MTPYQFTPALLVRTPLYAFDESTQNPAAILKTNQFKIALFLASRSLYSELEKTGLAFDSLAEKQKLTVRKYINRASFRATPFGLFSSVGLLTWSKTENDCARLSQPGLNVNCSFPVLENLGSTLPCNDSAALMFRSNLTVCFTKIDYRYARKDLLHSAYSFSMVSIDKNTLVKRLLLFCRTPKTICEMIDHLADKFGVDTSDANELLMQMMEIQLLVPANGPNITGADYQLRIIPQLAKTHSGLRHLQKPLVLTELNADESLKKLKSLAEQLDGHTGMTSDPNPFYAISNRRVLAGGLSSGHQQAIMDGLHCLGLLSRNYHCEDLETFKKSFLKKYDSGEVPLLEAIDAQFGIGYCGLDRPSVTYGVSSSLSREAASKNKSNTLNGDDIKSFLLNQWKLQDAGELTQEIKISDDLVRQMEKRGESRKGPPSISVLFKIAGDHVFLESAGGVSSLALLGRFAACEDIYKHARSIAEHEQQHNSDVVFAEIAHICNLHTANINRRPHFYDYEIPLLTASLLPEEKQIQLNDIMVSVSGNTVVLRSKRLNKRIIPRLSSAFNFTRNSFPPFRFLCDVQNEGLATTISFSLPALIPGLRFYPRVSYRSCILQLAEWHLDEEDLAPLLDNNPAGSFAAFQKLRKTRNLPRFFSQGIGDNFLVFDAYNEEDIRMLCHEVAKNRKAVLKEYPFMNGRDVRSVENKPLAAQFLASLVCKEQSYTVLNGKHGKRQFAAPGNEDKNWLYFKVYCHPLSSDIVLRNYLFPLAKKLLRTALVNKWFWIRYNDPEYHLRIRFETDEQNREAALQALTACLNKLHHSKLISHFQSGSYQRELERYSSELIEYAESVFHESSNIIANRIGAAAEISYDDQATMVDAVISVISILNGFGFTSASKAGFCKQQFQAFCEEFNSPSSLKAELETIYKKIDETVRKGMQQEGYTYKGLASSIKRLLTEFETTKPEGISAETLAADIIHMHLNRLFILDQRYFEMITYFLVYRKTNADLHRKINAGSALT